MGLGNPMKAKSTFSLVIGIALMLGTAPCLAQGATQGGGSGAPAGGRTSGKVTYYTGTYDGQLVNGQPDGYGVYVFKSGNRYQGQFRNGIKEGRGKFTWVSSGNTYDGQWKNDNRNGKGLFLWATGDS